MNNSPIPGAADSASPAAAFPTSTLPTPGVQETPDVPTPDLQLAPADGESSPTVVIAKPIAPLPDLPQSFGLQQRQRLALQALAAGNSVYAAARHAGVNPSTLFRWRRRDARFIAAFNAWRAQSQQTAHDCLVSAVEHAARNVLDASRTGDVRTSLTLLKGMGTLAPRQVGSESARIVAKQLEAEAQRLRAGRNRPYTVSLDRMLVAFEGIELDDVTRQAYRDAVAKHRAFLETRRKPPLPRPVTLESAQKPQPSRFSVEVEPNLSEYYRKVEQDRQEEEREAKLAEQAASADPAAPPPEERPNYASHDCTITITSIGPNRDKIAGMIAMREHVQDGVADARLNSLPYDIDSRFHSPWVEESAKTYEDLGATIEIRRVR